MPDGTEPPLDQGALAQLREIEAETGEPGLVRETLESISKDLAPRVAAVRAASVAADLRGMGSKAHALRGASALVGAEGLVNLALRIEAIAKGGAPADASPLIDELEREARRVAAALLEEARRW